MGLDIAGVSTLLFPFNNMVIFVYSTTPWGTYQKGLRILDQWCHEVGHELP